MAIDYSNTIRNLRNKLVRQQAAVQETEDQIAAFEELQNRPAKSAK